MRLKSVLAITLGIGSLLAFSNTANAAFGTNRVITNISVGFSGDVVKQIASVKERFSLGVYNLNTGIDFIPYQNMSFGLYLGVKAGVAYGTGTTNINGYGFVVKDTTNPSIEVYHVNTSVGGDLGIQLYQDTFYTPYIELGAYYTYGTIHYTPHNNIPVRKAYNAFLGNLTLGLKSPNGFTFSFKAGLGTGKFNVKNENISLTNYGAYLGYTY